MKILKAFEESPKLIAFDNKNLINNANIKIKNNHLTFNKGNEFFVFLDNFNREKELFFNIKNNLKTTIYLMSSQSRSIDIKYNFLLEENSSLKLITNFVTTRKTTAKVDFEFNLRENSELDLMNALTFKGDLALNTLVLLKGQQAKVNLDLLNVGGDESNYIVKQNVEHLEKYTVSNINNWLISTEKAKLSYSVTGFIEKGKEFSKCNQSNKGIMLSDTSEIIVEPKLLIDEYNVEASHGAAIGQMDELQLYYLLSRGLTEQEAKSLIISGYTNPFISNIENKDFADKLTSQISRLIRRKAKV